MNANDDFSKTDYKALKEVLRTGILRWHQQWQDDLVTLIQSPYPDGENVFDRNMEITKRSRDFFKEAMKMEDYYRRSWILDGIIRLMHEGYLTENDHKCVDLGLPSGNLWAAYNVGASKPEEAGSYYSWAETSEKDTYLSKTCFFYDMSCSELQQRGIIDENLNLTAEYDAATVNWGKQWHTPTRTDFDELFAYTTSYWGRVNGVNGRWFESLSNHNKIFMPAVGEIYEVYLNFYNERGYYWSATKYSADEYYKNWVDDIYFQNDCVNCYSTNRSAYFGHVVRPIRRP